MNGVVAVRSLLTGNASLTALVPESRITAGNLPQGSNLPAIALMSISGVDRNILKPGSRRQVTERVQVSVLAATYPAAKALLRAARAATADQMPTVTGIENVVVHTDAAGPDFTDPETGIFIQTQDLRVSFLETV